MEDFPLFRITAVASASSAGFALVGLIVAAICIFLPRAQTVSIKLLGSLMVLALTFAANNPFVYSLGIFIVATLVTDLDFLEKIAALFWNRDKYWEYRMGKVTPSEVKARVISEAEQEVEAESFAAPDKAHEGADPAAIKSYVTDALSFEQAVHHALVAGKGPFAPARVNANRKLVSPSGALELDAIIETSSTDYVVEIKYSNRPHVLTNALAALERRVRAYRTYLIERGVAKEVIPVAVIPAHVAGPSLFHGMMPVLRFDSATQEFTNPDEFLEAVRTLRRTNA